MPGEQSRINGRKNKNQGRPKKYSTLQAAIFRDKLAAEIAKDMEAWIIPMRHLVEGVKVQDEKTGVVYQRPPDPHAWQKVMDRAYGKPKETVEIQDESTEELIEEVDAMREDIRQLADDFDAKLKQQLLKK